MNSKALLAVVLLSLSVMLNSSAQSDNFDSGTLDPAWQRSHFNEALVNLSFPDTGTGKGLRIQAVPFPDAGAPAAAMFYREEVYTDFYLAVDIVDWPGTDLNQAMVLIARAHLTGNPAETTGIILNYDASQYGESPTSRRQGQLQINMITNNPPFGTKTIATAEVTFVPGRPYRLIFKGVGSHYTGQAYDMHDLTRPIVTVEADDDIQGSQSGGGDIFFDSGFKSGVSGFLSFSREGVSGVTDVTIDNYFAAAADPNPAADPALAHPVAGTPAVESRTPADRFTNFHDPAAGISFTAKTHTTDNIDASATRLLLNGADLSSQLVLPADGPSITVTLPGSALAANRVYEAQIELQDAAGTKKSTNTFWFDTFSDEYLASAAVKVIEAEDYNFANGQHLAEPIPVSGLTTNGVPVNGGGVGYWEQLATPEIDYHDTGLAPESTWFTEYRSGDAVGLSQGMFPEIEDLNESSIEPVRRSDHVRAKYASEGLLEFVVHRTQAGEWLNYTRDFTEGSYAVYLRAASFGATEVDLLSVTSDPTQPDQTTTPLGTFEVPNLFTRYNYRYIPLVTENGSPALLDLSGLETLRLQLGGNEQDQRKVALNYLLFVPQEAATLRVFSSENVDSGYTEDTSAVIDASAGRITIPITGTQRFFLINAPVSQQITSSTRTENSLVLTYEPEN